MSGTLHPAMPASAYHADPCEAPSLSASVAKILLAASPRHAWLAHPRLNPQYRPVESERFDLGSAAHALLLEGRDDMAVIDADDWRTKAAREARDAARAAGKLPVKRADYEAVHAMVSEARSFLLAADIHLSRGTSETTMIWTDNGPFHDQAPIWCRSRIDWLSNDSEIVVDYKTATTAQPEAFGRQIERMRYDIQAAFYLRGLRACGHHRTRFLFLAQEIEPPYACSLSELSPVGLEIAAVDVDLAIKIWRDCILSGEWPAYDTRIHTVEPRAWRVNEFLAEQES